VMVRVPKSFVDKTLIAGEGAGRRAMPPLGSPAPAAVFNVSRQHLRHARSTAW
jgi:hypothetical protein